MATLRYVLAVKAPIARVWRRWSTFEGFSDHFAFIRSVTASEDNVVFNYTGLFGGEHELKLVVTDRIKDCTLAFKGVDMDISGSVSLDAMGKNTLVTFVVSFDPPAARLGDIIADLTQYPARPLKAGLLAFHASMEKR